MQDQKQSFKGLKTLMTDLTIVAKMMMEGKTDEAITHQLKLLLNIVMCNKPEINLSNSISELCSLFSDLLNEEGSELSHRSLAKKILLEILDHDEILCSEVSNGAITPSISVERRIAIEAQAKNMYKIKYKVTERKAVKFPVGWTVGVRDLENNWRIAQVIHVLDCGDGRGYWYYVKFCNCSDDCNIWTQQPRIRYFNPKRDLLYRGKLEYEE